MNNFLILVFALVAGLLLGAIFFGGLWWTVRKGVFSKSPALWFLGSMLLRIYHRTFHCDAADPNANRASPLNSEGGQPCALVLMK